MSDLGYSGQGPLVASFPQYSAPTEWKAEETRLDGLGNTYHRQSSHPDEQPQRPTYSWPSGRLTQQVAIATGPLAIGEDWYPDSAGYTYDGSGNLRTRFRHTYLYLAGVASWEEERHWYGADDKLRFLQRNALVDTLAQVPVADWQNQFEGSVTPAGVPVTAPRHRRCRGAGGSSGLPA